MKMGLAYVEKVGLPRMQYRVWLKVQFLRAPTICMYLMGSTSNSPLNFDNLESEEHKDFGGFAPNIQAR